MMEDNLIKEMKEANVYPDNIGQNIDATFFYHGTCEDSKKKFENQGYLGHEYFGKIGLWITSDLHHACSFGNYIYQIGCVGILEELMDYNHPDDGIFYQRKIDFGHVTCLNEDIHNPYYIEMIRHKLDFMPH